ncbi:acyl-CoA dehydrogenase [Achromobacter sp. K91]|uniref:acyl-CoA dehydrogenase family protein n=1 Tax=Achromobacter sp. K91 TaxID=2292262 RepID=UPI000E66DF30|nr:acyl-CoA dehydrogenase family protein [Achromobacter sp. K91]RIJ03247.1 acyl-CoA dehydrogenase [Achromobacter sp. K91]
MLKNGIDEQSFSIFIDSVHRFIRERLMPLEHLVEETDSVPQEVIQELRELGMFGLSIPESYGGLGLSMSQECQVAFEIGQTSLAFRSVFGTNIGIGSQGILMDGTQEQRETILPRVASGELQMAFALTEPDAGTDAAAIKTVAVAEGDYYVLTGTKRFISNAPNADAFTLMARTGGVQNDGISAFFVPADSPGLSLGKPDKKMGQRGTKTCDVILEGVRVPASNIIGGEPGLGFKTAMKVLNRARLHLAAVACGMAKRALDESVSYARDRRQFGRPIGDFQLVQAMIADSQAELLAAWALVQETARRFDELPLGSPDPAMRVMTSSAKMFATEMAGRVADRGVQIHGGSGYMSEFAIERLYRDVRLLRLYEGTTQIQQVIIGRTLLKDIDALP